jgi:hypothetical protein
MSEHSFEDGVEERDDVVDASGDEGREDEPREDEPWAKTSSGNAEDITTDG